MLTKEDYKKWADALRSGEYQQCIGQHYNKNTNSFCCLGVLATILRPDAAIDDVGLWRITKARMSQEIAGQFVRMNDLQRNSFVQIAEHIERVYLCEQS